MSKNSQYPFGFNVAEYGLTTQDLLNLKPTAKIKKREQSTIDKIAKQASLNAGRYADKILLEAYQITGEKDES